MRLGGRRPGIGTSFVDTFNDDVLLQVTTNERGETLVFFHLYDSEGGVVADSLGLQSYVDGTEVRDARDELLLRIPSQPEQAIEYRLYSCRGTLLTCSDGARTQIFGGVRVEPTKPEAKQVSNLTPAAPPVSST